MRSFTIMGIVTGLLVFVSLAASPASLGGGAGIDPTGLVLFTGVADIALGESFGIRAELGFSTVNVEGLMLIGGLVYAHHPVEILDPFLGAGIGMALTKTGESAFTLEGAAGMRLALFGPLSAFADVRCIVRFTTFGINSGPLYEAGLAVSF